MKIMEFKHWHLVSNEGTQSLEYDGYFISVENLLTRPVFWTSHIAEKTWGTEPVVQELAAFAAGASAANKLSSPGFSRRRALALDAWERYRAVCGGPEDMPALFFAGFGMGVSERGNRLLNAEQRPQVTS